MQPSARYSSATADEATLVRDLGLLVRDLLARSNRGVFATFDELDLSFTQSKIVMSFMGRDTPRSVRAIADEHGLSLAAASRAVEALAGRGLVTRHEDPDDRRVKRIAPSAAGRALVARLFELRLAGIRQFVAGLDPDDRRRLAEALAPIFAADRPEVPSPAPAPDRTADA